MILRSCLSLILVLSQTAALAQSSSNPPRSVDDYIRNTELPTREWIPILQKMTVRDALAMIRTQASSDDMREITGMLKKLNIKEDVKLPQMKAEGKFISFAGDKGKYDLSRIGRGQIYDGAQFWRMNNNEGWSANYKTLFQFLKDSNTHASQFGWLWSEAFADSILGKDVLEISDREGTAQLAKWGTKALSFLATYAGIMMVKTLMDTVGIASLSFVAGYAGILALTTIVFYAISSLDAAIDRYGKELDVKCVDGKIHIVGKDHDEVIDTKFKDLAVQSGSQNIGLAELKVRQYLCENPSVQKKLTSMLKRIPGMNESSESPTVVQ